MCLYGDFGSPRQLKMANSVEQLDMSNEVGDSDSRCGNRYYQYHIHLEAGTLDSRLVR